MRFPFLLIALLLSFPALADVLWLTNGDRLTGEIEKLEKSSLTVRTAFAGPIKVNWDMVAQIESTRTFSVEVETGMQIQGSITLAGKGIRVQTPEREIHLSPVEVTRIEPLENETPLTFWQRVDIGANFGLNFTQGNSKLTQTSATVNGRYKTDKRQIQGTLSSIFSTEPDVERVSRHEGDLRYDHNLNPHLFWYGSSAFTIDERRLLDLRSTLGGGLGWKITRSQTTNVSLLGGFSYVNEQYRHGDGSPKPRSSTAMGQAGLEMEHYLNSRIRLYVDATVSPDFRNHGRYLFGADAGLRVPLNGFLTWNLSLFDRYDSEPPLAVYRNDWGIISGVGFDF